MTEETVFSIHFLEKHELYHALNMRYLQFGCIGKNYIWEFHQNSGIYVVTFRVFAADI